MVDVAKKARQILEMMDNRNRGEYVDRHECGRFLTGAMVRRNQCPTCYKPVYEIVLIPKVIEEGFIN